MNIIHIKYAIEVAKAGSINKASENLNMAQPNISRAIKDLESDLGIAIFDRSAKGMNLTSEGREFIARAQKILSQLNDLENMYRNGETNLQKFSVSAPRAGYIAEAFTTFSQQIDERPTELILDETDTYNTIKKVINSESKLGIIRYEEGADSNFKDMLDKSNLVCNEIARFKHVIVMGKDSPLCEKETIYESDLCGYIQITHHQPYEATIAASDDRKRFARESSNRCIFVLDTSAQFEILSRNDQTFMWVSPVPSELLARYDLVEREVSDNKKVYKDALIYRKDTKLSSLDNEFITKIKLMAGATITSID